VQPRGATAGLLCKGPQPPVEELEEMDYLIEGVTGEIPDS
jgi:hypothetical protein